MTLSKPKEGDGMGAWGSDIAESDNAYDLLDYIEEKGDFDPYEMIHGRKFDREAAAKSLQKHAKSIEKKIEGDDWDFGAWGVLYTAMLLNAGVTLNEDQKDLFARAYEKEINDTKRWFKPDERMAHLKRVKEAVKNGTGYEFGSKGLMETIQEAVDSGKTGLLNSRS